MINIDGVRWTCSVRNVHLFRLVPLWFMSTFNSVRTKNSLSTRSFIYLRILAWFWSVFPGSRSAYVMCTVLWESCRLSTLSVSTVQRCVDVLVSLPDILALGRQQKAKLFLHICNCCLYCLICSRSFSLPIFYLDICRRLWTVKSRAYKPSIFNSKPCASTCVYVPEPLLYKMWGIVRIRFT